ncbi:helix-turn-helix transcriptional regulator [Rhodalgimonas zhirmunskyi]|uniref:YafY family transcriptional regulator n=1 Tax=Rhodalgimonas zhirmunskyi TaxID=2964767 RepID=A0AAJ1UCE0_9RHOB|nr:YafY family protein [Rhodoalgimonas zhirmunskyi]MDQ2095940.1 YafY family transcriptional regulator [Rhodoalgimonas zhirmunskyi]
MRRADRLFQIVQHLRGGRLVTAKTLAERLEVSPRTIYRDIADLIGSGVPIEGEAGVGYVMRVGYDLPPLMFTNDEITALVAGARMIRAWGGMAMAEAAEEALIKIEAVLPDAVRARLAQVQVHAMQTPDMPMELREQIDRIETLIAARTTAHIRYADGAGAASDRVIRPLGLYYWGKVWTLVAWCELRNDFRVFRADRISDMTPGARFRVTPETALPAFYEKMRRQGMPDIDKFR